MRDRDELVLILVAVVLSTAMRGASNRGRATQPRAWPNPPPGDPGDNLGVHPNLPTHINGVKIRYVRRLGKKSRTLPKQSLTLPKK